MQQAQFLLSGLSCAALLFGGPASADNFSPFWLRDLTLQLEFDKQCEVEFYIRANEYGPDASGYVQARAKCKDGREFDAYRENSNEDFTILECAHAVCENTDFKDIKDPA